MVSSTGAGKSKSASHYQWYITLGKRGNFQRGNGPISHVRDMSETGTESEIAYLLNKHSIGLEEVNNRSSAIPQQLHGARGFFHLCSSTCFI